MSCNAKKDPNGTWRIQYRWTDWTGTKKKSQKRGFKTKKEAEEWYAHFMLQQSSDPTMTLADFWEIYKADMEKRLRKTTMKQKKYVMNDKILPYFGKTPINEITAPMIRKWQGEMMEKGFKPTYLKTIHNQLSAILNYAVNFYDLRSNPCRKAGSMGKSKADERPYWTLEEFQKFSDAIMDKQDSWIAFQILFWTGMRIGELLPLIFSTEEGRRKDVPAKILASFTFTIFIFMWFVLVNLVLCWMIYGLKGFENISWMVLSQHMLQPVLFLKYLGILLGLAFQALLSLCAITLCVSAYQDSSFGAAIIAAVCWGFPVLIRMFFGGVIWLIVDSMPIFLVMTGIVNDIYEIWYIVLGINVCFAIGCLVKGLVSYKTKQFA